MIPAKSRIIRSIFISGFDLQTGLAELDNNPLRIDRATTGGKVTHQKYFAELFAGYCIRITLGFQRLT